jgi:3-dehydroquinate synthase
VQRFDLTFERPGSRVCKVCVGNGALDECVGETLAANPGRQSVVVSDTTVGRLYGKSLTARLGTDRLPALHLTFPAGEPHKSRETKSRLEDELLEAGVGRDVTFIAVGGGVTGDLAGFLAATWHRGAPVIQVPTTLLAMSDAALGGKTAINLPGGKNLVGAIHQPIAVYADIATLSTLPDAVLVEGFSEIVKAAVIADPSLFEWLESAVPALTARETAVLERSVAASLSVKAAVVNRDEREFGWRSILNFGHTVAHGIEVASDYRVTHGRAVSIGMVAEARLAVEATGFPQAVVQRLETLLQGLGLPIRLPEETEVPLEELLVATRRDKKARQGRARYALPTALGKMRSGGETMEIEESRLRTLLRELRI